MIAACPKCHTRYRVQPEQLGADGARLRCSHCQGVFRVRLPPSSPQASPASAQRGEAERSHQDGSAPAALPPRDRHGSAPAALPPRDRHGSAPAAPPPRDSDASAPTSSRSLDLDIPDPNEPGPVFDRRRLVVVAHADPEMRKVVAEALEGWGLQTLVAQDGVEAILSIQRTLPRVVVLDAALPKMYGFQVCEVVKRNESLRKTSVVLVGAVYKDDRYRRAPSQIYGADVYVEPPDLPDALHGILTGFGVDLEATNEALVPDPSPRAPGRYGHVARGGRSVQPAADPAISADSASTAEPFDDVPAGIRQEVRERPRPPEREPERGMPGRESMPLPAPEAVRSADAAPALDADPLEAERAKAERLARIIVSDIALYNPEKFAAAASSGGDALAAMRGELEEARALFRERIDASVRAERDHLAEELLRAAKVRSGQG